MHRSQSAVEDRAVRVADDVGRHQRLVGVAQDPLQRAVGRGLEGGIQLIHAGRALGLERQVDERARDDGRADREAVQLAAELRKHQRDGLRRAGRRRDEVDGRSASTAQVAVRTVLQVLVARVGVDRRHQAVLDADRVVGDLRERRQAVRRAGRVGDDVVAVLVVGVEVDAEHDGDVLALGRRGDDDLLDAAAEVLGGVVTRGEEAGRLDHDLGPDGVPVAARAGSRSANTFISSPSITMPCSVASTSPGYGPRIESYLNRWASDLRIGEVVDGDDVDVGARGLCGADDVAADAAEAVDADAYGHG